VSTAVNYTVTTESNVVCTAVVTITIPAPTARRGPIRLKDNALIGGSAVTCPVGTINGGAFPVVIPPAGFTLVSDGAGNWESFA